MEIRITKGLNIPIEGAVESSQIHSSQLSRFAIDLRPFIHLSLSTTLEEGMRITKQSPIAEETQPPYRIFTAPTEATVVQIIRGEKRKLLEIILDPVQKGSPINPQMHLLDLPSDEISYILRKTGLFKCFKSRPFGLVCDPTKPPRSIFIQCLETAPFAPSAELQLKGREQAFITGLKLIEKLTNSPIHLITKHSSPFIQLAKETRISIHTINPLHPSSSPSIAIQLLDPIRSLKDRVWTTTYLEVIQLGSYCLSGDLWIDTVTAIAGSQIPIQNRHYLRTYPGTSIESLLHRIPLNEPYRIISGDPLTGERVERSAFLRHGTTVLSVLKEPDPVDRPFLPFMRFFSKQYTATDTYLQKNQQSFSFSTLKNGELRGLIDTSIYDKVLPFDILPVPLIKAIIGKDYEKALQYGLLEVVPEDFALADFICPSKVCMMQIVRQGQHECLT